MKERIIWSCSRIKEIGCVCRGFISSRWHLPRLRSWQLETLIVILYLRIFLPVFTFIIITSLITRAIRNWSIWTLIDPPTLLTLVVVRFHTDFPLNTRLSSLTRPWNWAVHRGLAELKRNHRIYDIIIPTALPPLSFRWYSTQATFLLLIEQKQLVNYSLQIASDELTTFPSLRHVYYHGSHNFHFGIGYRECCPDIINE